jgi:FkbM family methyltransferase
VIGLRSGVRLRFRRAVLELVRRKFAVVGLRHAAGVLVLPSDDRTILRKLFLGGNRSDYVVLERAARVLRDRGRPAGGTFVDVGANLGTTTLAAVRLHGFDRAVACEPDPRNARYLRATVAVNGLDGVVTVVEAAIADHVGSATFTQGGAEPDGRKSGAGALGEGGAVQVGVTTLDALAGGGVLDPASVALLWLDVQGAEGYVFAGATQLLDAGVAVVAAVRKLKLERAGGLELFREQVKGRFASLVDLRAPNLKPGWQPAFEPVSALDDVLERTASTDVLFLP